MLRAVHEVGSDAEDARVSHCAQLPLFFDKRNDTLAQFPMQLGLLSKCNGTLIVQL